MFLLVSKWIIGWMDIIMILILSNIFIFCKVMKRDYELVKDRKRERREVIVDIEDLIVCVCFYFLSINNQTYRFVSSEPPATVFYARGQLFLKNSGEIKKRESSGAKTNNLARSLCLKYRKFILFKFISVAIRCYAMRLKHWCLFGCCQQAILVNAEGQF